MLLDSWRTFRCFHASAFLLSLGYTLPGCKRKMIEGNLVLNCCYSLPSYGKPQEHIHRDERLRELSAGCKLEG